MTRIMSTILTFLFTSSIAFSADVCEGEGARYGDGTGKDVISSSCLIQIKESALPKTKKTFSNGLSVYGHLDILFIDKEDHAGRAFIIAGKSTRLTKILAIALDEAHGEIGVLDQSGNVYFFSVEITGNITPLRVLKTSEMEGVSDLKVLPENDEVALLKEAERKILVYSRLANSRARADKRKLNRIRVISIPASAQVSTYFQNLK